jgi:hypothetical protein
MGASAWSYFVPYQDNVQQAFQQLQQQVFTNGNYLKPWDEPSATPVPFHGVPSSIEELLTLAGTAGTHSILDLSTTMPLQPVSSDVLEQIFTTTHPTHAMLEAAEQGWELWTLADGDYLIVYTAREPDELYFFGTTGD